MEIKTILHPKKMLIGFGSFMLLMSVFGVIDGGQMAEDMWGADNVAEHDAEYEQMWALHMMPLFGMAVVTGLLVQGKALAQMAMAASAFVLVFMGGGMMYLTNESGYGSGSHTLMIVIFSLSALIGVAGYLHKDGDNEPEESV
jgi:hypothetical protein